MQFELRLHMSLGQASVKFMTRVYGFNFVCNWEHCLRLNMNRVT